MSSVPLFVNGEGMRGGSVHHNITGYPFLGESRTAPRYRFYSVADRFPALWEVPEGGVEVPGELYEVPLAVIRDQFMPDEPPELELGVIALENDGVALAVLLRREALEAGGLTDISGAGGWHEYRRSMGISTDR